MWKSPSEPFSKKTMPSNIEIQSKDNSVSISTIFFNSRPIFALLDFTMPTLHKQYLAAEHQVDN